MFNVRSLLRTPIRMSFQRISIFANLPLASLDELALTKRVREIGIVETIVNEKA